MTVSMFASIFILPLKSGTEDQDGSKGLHWRRVALRVTRGGRNTA